MSWNKYIQHRFLFLPVSAGVLAFSSMVLFSSETQAQPDVIPIVSAPVEASPLMEQIGIMPALETGRVMSVKFVDPNGLKAFYTERDFKPLWLRGRGGRSDKLEQVLDVLGDAWRHGMNPEDYHQNEIISLLAAEDDESLFALELITSDAVVRYIRDLSAMRVAPKLASISIRDMQMHLLTEDVLGYLSGKSNVRSALHAFEPKGNLYTQMQEELNDLLHSSPKPYEDILPIRMNGLLKPGMSAKSVSAIRVRLGVNAPSAEQVGYYDDTLARAVIRFQKKNGLQADGVIGPKTLEILNITRQQKIEQLIANLERLRWVARDKPERYILVNIPSAQLWAIENGRVVLDMPVILGRKKRATESFVTEIKGIRFNPNWTIPPTIKKEDFLPNLVEDPYYATNRGVEFVQGYGENAMTLDPGTIDWSMITWEEFKQIRMIQAPGQGNPLGQIRVLMPNRYNIYLHDTSTPQDFQKGNRFISSGCVRVSDPEALTNFIMGANDSWSGQLFSEVIGHGRTEEKFIEESLPVFILYQTVWLNEDGDIVYGPDVYDRDRDLINYMKQNKLFALPTVKKTKDQIVYNSPREGVAPSRFNP